MKTIAPILLLALLLTLAGCASVRPFVRQHVDNARMRYEIWQHIRRHEVLVFVGNADGTVTRIGWVREDLVYQKDEPKKEKKP